MVGLLQAVTQIQEQSLAFVPKIIAMLLLLTFCCRGSISQMLHYTNELIAGIPAGSTRIAFAQRMSFPSCRLSLRESSATFAE